MSPTFAMNASSRSTNGTPSRCASNSPAVLLPTPPGPTSRIMPFRPIGLPNAAASGAAPHHRTEPSRLQAVVRLLAGRSHLSVQNALLMGRQYSFLLSLSYFVPQLYHAVLISRHIFEV